MNQYQYPLLLKPIPVPKVWAGGKLAKIPGRQASESNDSIGESWDISTWPTAPDNPALITVTRITNGPLAGTPLDRVAQLPVVVKVIDSGDNLSVQNHPNLPDEHKNEMWYLLEADPNAYLYYGLAKGVTPDQFCSYLRKEPQDNDEILNALVCYRNLKQGDYFHVPAPTIHALGPGLLTFEISERSQVTYRLYDYNRPRSRGKLDIDPGCKALLASHPELPTLQPELRLEGADHDEIISAFASFCVVKVTGQQVRVESAGHQHLVTATKGDCKLSGPTPDWDLILPYSFTCLVPATDQAYTIDTQGSGEVLISPLQD